MVTVNEIIRNTALAQLRLVYYPDPRLTDDCRPVEDPTEPAVTALAERMFEIMFESRGVGLAAPQVGIPARLFVASPGFNPQDRHVYINPQIISADGSREEEEGCLSLPGVFSRLKRYDIVTIRAQNLEGAWFEQTGEELTARVFQHEMDHLDGRLIIDRMGSLARMAHRKTLQELQQRYQQ